LAFAPPALAADPWSRAQVMTVVMVDNSFQPDHLTFRSGQPYELRLENHGKDMHEFTAPAFLKAARVRDKRLLANGGTDIVVSSGKSVSIFLIPGPAGQYDLTCADHDWDGMVGGITVD
jgi:plastocyanin